MAAIILPHRWRASPQQACEVDTSHPLARGLTSLSVNGYDAMRRKSAITIYRETSGAFRATLPNAENSGETTVFAVVDQINSSGYNPHILSAGGWAWNSGGDNSGTILWWSHDFSRFELGLWNNNSAGIHDPSSTSLPYFGKCVAGVYDGTNGILYVDGVSVASSAFTAPRLTGTDAEFGNFRGNGTVNLRLGAVWNRALSANELKSLSENPYQLLKPIGRRFYLLAPAGGAVTGSLAVTESGPDTLSGSGNVIVSGALASAETGSDTAAASGIVIVSGAFAATEGSDTLAGAGTIKVLGTFAATEAGADGLAGVGAVLVQGVLAGTDSGQDTIAAAGTVANTVFTGSMAASETGADTIVVTGVVLIRGALSVTETGADTFAASSSADVQYPLAGVTQARPIITDQQYPLAGVNQTRPLG